MLSGDVIENAYPDLGKILLFLIGRNSNDFLVNATANYTNQYEIEKAEFASSFACLIGIFQILLGIFQFHRVNFKLNASTFQPIKFTRSILKFVKGFHFFYHQQ